MKIAPAYFTLVLLCLAITCFSQTVDTIFYNNRWQISEKPFASYYRHATLVNGNPKLEFNGPVTDYYESGKIEMTGMYRNGKREGLFRFYYPDGQLESEGHYQDNFLHEDWTYYYPGGRKKAVLNHRGKEGDFLVKEYIDEKGKTWVKEGNGEFQLLLYDQISRLYFRVTGAMKNGKAHGHWKFYPTIPTKYGFGKVMRFKKVFVHGKLTKMMIYNQHGAKTATYFDLVPSIAIMNHRKFDAIDHFIMDPLLFHGIKSDQHLVNFVVKKIPPDIAVDTGSFEESFNSVLTKLNDPLFRVYFDDAKNYEGEINFTVSGDGLLENLDIKGNVSAVEKARMASLLRHFRNVKPIQYENVGITANHRIYFFTVDGKEMLPKRYHHYSRFRHLLFSVIPYEKMVRKLNDDVKLRIESYDKMRKQIFNNIRWQMDRY